MRTSWEASWQAWEVFIDDSEDPALAELGFPGAASAWLRDPEERLEPLDALRVVSAAFTGRLQRFLDEGQVQAICLADAAGTRSRGPRDVAPPGKAHCGLLGPDWTDKRSWIRSKEVPEWVWSLAVSFEPTCEGAPSWEAFTETSVAFRRACESLTGLAFGPPWRRPGQPGPDPGLRRVGGLLRGLPDPDGVWWGLPSGGGRAGEPDRGGVEPPALADRARGDPSIVGKMVTVDSGTGIVVGIAPPELRYPRDAALWALPGLDWPNLARRGRTWDVVARLAANTTPERAQSELTGVAARARPARSWRPARDRVLQVGAQVPPGGFRTVQSVIDGAALSQRFTAALLLVFGVVALVVAAVGIYGVVSYQVTERVREMAVRMSIGATPGNVIGLILTSGARIWGVGLVAGLVGAFAARGLVATQLYGVSATDPVIFIGSAVVLGLVAAAATSPPAVMATRVEPGSILREG